MNTTRKLLAMVLALIMVMSLATSAFAAETDPKTYTVTINNATGHSYEIYQIFTGDLATEGEDKILSNIKYGDNYGEKGKPVPDEFLESLTEENIASKITPTGTGKPMTTDGDTATISGLEAGYYMIKDVTNPLPDGDELSKVMFQVVGDTVVTSKHTGTTIVKKVQDINDSTGEQPTDGNSTWIDSADYDINDTVPFQSTANFEGLDNYETYRVVFTDTMSKGLTYNNDMKVFVNDEDKTASFTITTATYTGNDEYAGGTVITVECSDITALTDANAVQIVLQYSATLNDDAKLGAPGNPNKIKVTTQPDGTGETPEDVNIVFTYKVVANKYANAVGEDKKLTGAGFTLYKWYGTAESGEWRAIGEEIKGEALSTFEWKGIDDGKYKLVETTTPAGYNTIADIEFTVTATHEIVSDHPALTDLSGNATTGEVTFTANTTEGSLSTDVINKSGTELPETGGMGTTMFYVIGGILVLAAVVLLVTKRRMTIAE